MISIEIDDGSDAMWRWDKGRRVILHDVTEGTEVHFANDKSRMNAFVQKAYEDSGRVYADVPNVILQTAGTMYVYIYMDDGSTGQTKYKKRINIYDREKPDDYIYTEEEIRLLDVISSRVDGMEERLNALETGGGGVTVRFDAETGAMTVGGSAVHYDRETGAMTIGGN